MKLSLLPEIRPEIVRALGGPTAARTVLDALLRRQLLVTRGKSAHTVFHLHDLLRDYLRSRLFAELAAPDLMALMEQLAAVLDEAGYKDAAIDLAQQAQAWPLARRLILAHAQMLLAQLDGWLCYWLGVANAPDDAVAESCLRARGPRSPRLAMRGDSA